MARKERSEYRSASLAIPRIAASILRVGTVGRAAVVEEHSREWSLAGRTPEQAAEPERPTLYHDRIRSNKVVALEVRCCTRIGDQGEGEHQGECA